MASVSDDDRYKMRRLAQASARLERETGWGMPAERAAIIALVNSRRELDGSAPLDPEPPPPELGFHERARDLGLVRDPRRPA